MVGDITQHGAQLRDSPTPHVFLRKTLTLMNKYWCHICEFEVTENDTVVKTRYGRIHGRCWKVFKQELENEL